MNIKRILKHLAVGQASVSRKFPRATLKLIEQTIAEVEQNCAGQVRFAVEHALELSPLLAGQTARERSIEVFSQLRVWDTEQNNGVLIYLLLADRDVEIVADRGVHAKLGQQVWESICQEMESAFRQGDFEAGVIAGIRSVGTYLAKHYPASSKGKVNELPDSPVVL